MRRHASALERDPRWKGSTHRRWKRPCVVSSSPYPNANGGITLPSRLSNSVLVPSPISPASSAATKRPSVVANANWSSLPLCRRDALGKKGRTAQVGQGLPRSGRRFCRCPARLHGRRSDASGGALDQSVAASYPRRLDQTRVPHRCQGGGETAPPV